MSTLPISSTAYREPPGPDPGEVAAASKVAWHRARLERYLAGERVLPVTLELDLTSACTRACEDCPSTRASEHHAMPWEQVDRLLSCLAGETRGLLMTGGEATMSPLFARTLERARELGFVDVSVVTNGSLLDQPRVAAALLEHASTIRLSLYDWSDGHCEELSATLERIERLRARIDASGSRLEIGISALTSAERAPRLADLVASVEAAGAHWVYFHPMCIGWGTGDLEMLPQEGVLEEVERIRERQRARGGIDATIGRERYGRSSLRFSSYHAAHFLLIVGADGVNYRGAEVKYQPQHALARLEGSFDASFLWREERLERIALPSSAYQALGSRHRGVLYGDFIERLRAGDVAAHAELRSAPERSFRFPHLL